MATKKENGKEDQAIPIERFRHLAKKTKEPSQEPAKPVVSQSDLESIMTYRALLASLKKQMSEIQCRVIEKLAAGAEVEDGKRWVHLRSRSEGGEYIQWIEVD